jgi:hypothetical protein
MGDDTGLAHSWTDHHVTNGIRYYYAVCSYDKGSIEKPVSPVECAKAIKDPERITEPNVVAVVPNAKPLGYTDPEILEFTHSGNADAAFSLQVLDPSEITGHSYRVSFDTTQAAWTTLAVFDEDRGAYVIENDGRLEGQEIIFDGLDLTIVDVDSIEAVDSLLAWTAGDCNYDISVTLYHPQTNIWGVRYPADLEIRILDRGADTSKFIDPRPVNFQVWNVSQGVPCDFVFTDSDEDSLLTSKDSVVPLIYQNGIPTGTWDIKIEIPPDSVVTDTIWVTADSFTVETDTIETVAIDPRFGDVAFIEITEPITAGDQLAFSTQGASTAGASEDLLDQIKVVPNPYVSAAKWETLPPDIPPGHGRGERRIDFIHLPRQCTIRIYTIYGDLVQIIEHEDDLYDGSESWNLLSKDDMEVAYGVYIYHVQSPIGEKIGKFAIIK